MTARIRTERNDWSVTVGGRRMFILDPNPSDIDIEDIATGLSNICRFGGQVKSFYSVAQHSLMVSRLVPSELALVGLLHDATEAYLGDIISPLKRQLPEYESIEFHWWAAVCTRFGLPLTMPPDVKKADIRALLTEREHLQHRAVWQWVANEHEYELAKWSDPLTPAEARAAFLQRFAEV